MPNKSYSIEHNNISDILHWIDKGTIGIPEMQRPFVWSTTQVRDLIDSLYRGYPIGFIVIGQNPDASLKMGGKGQNKEIIIDGQQRISTLALIRRVLKESLSGDFQDKCNLTYSHTLSFDHLRQNYDYIRTWISKLTEIKGFAEYLETKCEYVVLEITGKDGLSLAFKLFDSQNGRGKPLEAYNLLKAYHL